MLVWELRSPGLKHQSNEKLLQLNGNNLQNSGFNEQKQNQTLSFFLLSVGIICTVFGLEYLKISSAET